jgi:hypothetical protein
MDGEDQLEEHQSVKTREPMNYEISHQLASLFLAKTKICTRRRRSCFMSHPLLHILCLKAVQCYLLMKINSPSFAIKSIVFTTELIWNMMQIVKSMKLYNITVQKIDSHTECASEWMQSSQVCTMNTLLQESFETVSTSKSRPMINCQTIEVTSQLFSMLRNIEYYTSNDRL